MNDNRALQELLDRQAITDALYRYCRSVDRIDPELGYSVFHEDAQVDYGRDIFQGTGRGFIDWCCNSHKNCAVTTHSISNIQIELDGDRAGSETCIIMADRLVFDGVLKFTIGWYRYCDNWERRDGTWAIAKRVTVCDFCEIQDANPMGALEYDPTTSNRGTRDRSDPSYAVLKRRK